MTCYNIYNHLEDVSFFITRLIYFMNAKGNINSNLTIHLTINVQLFVVFFFTSFFNAYFYHILNVTFKGLN